MNGETINDNLVGQLTCHFAFWTSKQLAREWVVLKSSIFQSSRNSVLRESVVVVGRGRGGEGVDGVMRQSLLYWGDAASPENPFNDHPTPPWLPHNPQTPGSQRVTGRGRNLPLYYFAPSFVSNSILPNIPLYY